MVQDGSVSAHVKLLLNYYQTFVLSRTNARCAVEKMRKGDWWKAFGTGRVFFYLTEFFLSIYRFIYLLLLLLFFGENTFFTSYKPGYVQTNMKGRTPYEFKNNKLYLGLLKKEIHWHCLSPILPPPPPPPPPLLAHPFVHFSPI